MSFEKDKQNSLSKKDKSAKGSVDKDIKELCSRINSLDDYYTTSSCAGRTVLIKLPESGKKNEAEWLFVSHTPVEPANTCLFSDKINNYNIPDEEVWFKFEPFILHVACRDIEAANRMISAVHESGMKRAGIISLGKKIVIEIIGNEHIAAPLSKKKKLFVDEKYIQELAFSANAMMTKNLDNIKKLEEALSRFKS
jgi:tRNA wybutosine-synthesizing protein 3